jgi:hypothetical protein
MAGLENPSEPGEEFFRLVVREVVPSGEDGESSQLPQRVLLEMLMTRVGRLELRVSQDRDGNLNTQAFERYLLGGHSPLGAPALPAP